MAHESPMQQITGGDQELPESNQESNRTLSETPAPTSPSAELANSPATNLQNSKDQTHAIQNDQMRSEDAVPESPIFTRNAFQSDEWAEFSDSFEQNIAEPGRKAIHKFFFPRRQQNLKSKSLKRKKSRNKTTDPPLTLITTATATTDTWSPLREIEASPANTSTRPILGTPPHSTTPKHRRRAPTSTPTPTIEEDPEAAEQDRQDREYMEKFWTTYDDIIILSLFTQLGILCRLGMASWLRIFDGVFQNDSALFTNLPLNCFSCFVMGILCSGESLMQIIGTRFTPPRLQQELHREVSEVHSHVSRDTLSVEEDLSNIDDRDSFSPSSKKSVRHHRRQRQPLNLTPSWQSRNENLQDELRDVQLMALERRIRASPCLVLFPGKKQDVDVVENYFHDGYQGQRDCRDSVDVMSSTPPKNEEGRRLHFGEDGPRHATNTSFSFDNHDLVLDEEMCTPVKAEKDGALNIDHESLEEISIEQDEFNDEFVLDDTDTDVDKASATKCSRRKAILKSKVESAERRSKTERSDTDLGGENFERQRPHLRPTQYGKVEGGNVVDYGTQDHPDLDQIITNVAADVSQKISRIKRVRLVDGWDVGTTPEEKSEDLILGLRMGLCGALSSFSSWISAMVNLMRGGNIGQAFVGLVLGIQLPIVAYRFGQHVAVFIFVWRYRRETKRDNRRGYGLRLNTDDDDDGEHGVIAASTHSIDSGDSLSRGRRLNGRHARTVQEEASETPSVRAIITAIFIMALVAQATALNFFYDPQQRLVALSLLFSPLGVLARWRLSMLNSWRPNFPVGTFACNIGACALSGSLGSLLAGNPGPRERIVLVAIIAGFGGTLSSVARFIVEILAGVDPILFRVDGVYYAVISLFWGMLVSFLFTASGDWADYVE